MMLSLATIIEAQEGPVVSRGASEQDPDAALDAGADRLGAGPPFVSPPPPAGERRRHRRVGAQDMSVLAEAARSPMTDARTGASRWEAMVTVWGELSPGRADTVECSER